jgi:UDP:flavonoid glycosyltransferase YjiC (YdhE family)
VDQQLSREVIAKVKSNPRYRDKALWFQKVLRETRGLDVAADIIERVFGADEVSVLKEANGKLTSVPALGH